LKNTQYLEKATFTSGTDLASGGLLSPEQADAFLKIAVKASPVSAEAVVRTMNATKWEEATLSWGGRILRPGVEGDRLAVGDRVKPTAGKVELSTVLIKGEVPVTDEVMEDNVEKAGFADSIATYIAERSGEDLEDLFVRGDTDDSYVGHGELAGEYLRLLNGIIKLGKATNEYDAVGDGTDYPTVFDGLINLIGDEYRRDMTSFRLYVSPTVKEIYHSQIGNRGTVLGDSTLIGANVPPYKGIKIVQVPRMPSGFIQLIQPSNIYIGFNRKIKLERFRDPREGVTSFIVTVRGDVKIPVAAACAVAKNVATS
jgi:HK97 family phage major capsid protein